MNIALVYSFLILSVFRLTIFITDDDFPPMRWIRQYISNKHYDTRRFIDYFYVNDDQKYNEDRGPWEPLATLINCYWCVSVWLSLILTTITWATMDSIIDPLWLWYGAVAGGSAIVLVIVKRMMHMS